MLPPLPLYGEEKQVACTVEWGRGTLYPLKCEQLWGRVGEESLSVRGDEDGKLYIPIFVAA
jgi:hypothetical protein